mmetsp:Transcript_9902/g.24753  ORF Transcript_9902/g.24753 Transcript_9902/m.24753 type:complete len:224 (-) Transcript_9902:419-1090(-)
MHALYSISVIVCAVLVESSATMTTPTDASRANQVIHAHAARCKLGSSWWPPTARHQCAAAACTVCARGPAALHCTARPRPRIAGRTRVSHGSHGSAPAPPGPVRALPRVRGRCAPPRHPRPAPAPCCAQHGRSSRVTPPCARAHHAALTRSHVVAARHHDRHELGLADHAVAVRVKLVDHVLQLAVRDVQAQRLDHLAQRRQIQPAGTVHVEQLECAPHVILR